MTGTSFFSSRRRHTRYIGDWSSDVCSSDLIVKLVPDAQGESQIPAQLHGILGIPRSGSLTPAELDGVERRDHLRSLALQEMLKIGKSSNAVSLIRGVVVGLDLLKPAAKLDPMDALDERNGVGHGKQIPGDVVELLRPVRAGTRDCTELAVAHRSDVDVADRQHQHR